MEQFRKNITKQNKTYKQTTIIYTSPKKKFK